uniref:Uncharacterized protein n=1 Tax=Arundo donax TaxID=35708 RepID=A0A0A9A5M3_ARUDO
MVVARLSPPPPRCSRGIGGLPSSCIVGGLSGHQSTSTVPGSGCHSRSNTRRRRPTCSGSCRTCSRCRRRRSSSRCHRWTRSSRRRRCSSPSRHRHWATARPSALLRSPACRHKPALRCTTTTMLLALQRRTTLTPSRKLLNAGSPWSR